MKPPATALEDKGDTDEREIDAGKDPHPELQGAAPEQLPFREFPKHAEFSVSRRLLTSRSHAFRSMCQSIVC